MVIDIYTNYSMVIDDRLASALGEIHSQIPWYADSECLTVVDSQFSTNN